LGDVVGLKWAFLNEPIGTLAYCYEEYKIGQEDGCSFITINGVDLGGFSADEQWKYLEMKFHSLKHYTFRSVIYLARDFEAGWFNDAFTKQ